MTEPVSWRWDGAKFEPCDSLPLADRGFRYGMAFFETLRVQRGRVVFVREHLALLAESCVSFGFLNPANIESALIQLTFADEVNGVLRLHVTAGPGAMLDPVNNGSIYLQLERRKPMLAENFRLRFHPEPMVPVFGGMKTHNYWQNLHALRQAKLAGCDECLLCDPNGYVFSASTSNVVFKIADELVTPATGARAGVTRTWVNARLANITKNDALLATEIFLTNSWIGIQPVSTLDGKILPETKVARALQSKFLRQLEGRP